MEMQENAKKQFNRTGESASMRKTKMLVTVALFGAVSYLLMLFESPAYIGFLRLELSDIPAIIATFQFGPLAGVLVELIKNLLKVLVTKTAGIGELANLIVGVAYVLPLGLIYHKTKLRHRVVMGFVAGTLAMTLVGAVFNYFVLVPFYATLYGGLDNIVGLAASTLPMVSDLKTLVVIGIVPFNIVKGIINSILSFAVFKIVKNVIR